MKAETQPAADPSLKKVIRKHTDLEVYRRAFAAALRIHKLTGNFPAEEKYSLTDQFRRSSRSVCANIAEAWRKRRYRAAWISKLGDSEAEGAETQVWIQFSVEFGYLERKKLPNFILSTTRSLRCR